MKEVSFTSGNNPLLQALGIKQGNVTDHDDYESQLIYTRQMLNAEVGHLADSRDLDIIEIGAPFLRKVGKDLPKDAAAIAELVRSYPGACTMQGFTAVIEDQCLVIRRDEDKRGLTTCCFSGTLSAMVDIVGKSLMDIPTAIGIMKTALAADLPLVHPHSFDVESVLVMHISMG
ncbi:MAG: hypothetical protein HOE53_04400 [Candidatus Magasanikbacteria bacterium]|nr:hypothetical protein [Candidatus Magasanikbacteria bacterium]